MDLFPFWAILISIFEIVGSSEIESICRSEQRQYSCGRCIEAHASCSWCTDPDFAGTFRCDSLDNLVGSCQKDNLVKLSEKVTKLSDRPVQSGSNQLQPQQVQMELRMGQTVSFELKYLHLSSDRSRDIYILNSETESRGLHLSYGSICMGRRVEGQSCAGARPNDVVVFTVNATLRSCDNRGDIVVSIGVAGVREVSALYVAPICGCPCEAEKPNDHLSPNCNNAGNLVCGGCVCIAGRTGRKCECSGEEDRCRQSATSPVCSGRGRCECGRCMCSDAETIKGEFCECDITMCPRNDGVMCSGKGTCDCGKCMCESDRTGEACECPMDESHCITKEGSICNNRGECECGKCTCQENFEGDLCELVSEYDSDMNDDQSNIMTSTFASTYATKKQQSTKTSAGSTTKYQTQQATSLVTPSTPSAAFSRRQTFFSAISSLVLFFIFV